MGCIATSAYMYGILAVAQGLIAIDHKIHYLGTKMVDALFWILGSKDSHGRIQSA